MARQKLSPEGREPLNMVAPPDLIKALDEWTEEERAAHPGRHISRAGIIREILYKAIADRQRERSDKSKPATPKRR